MAAQGAALQNHNNELVKCACLLAFVWPSSVGRGGVRSLRVLFGGAASCAVVAHGSVLVLGSGGFGGRAMAPV